VRGVPHAGAWRTKRRIFTTNYEPKSPVRHASDRSDEKTVIVRGALMIIGELLTNRSRRCRKTNRQFVS
jgi:hypothetical protein